MPRAGNKFSLFSSRIEKRREVGKKFTLRLNYVAQNTLYSSKMKGHDVKLRQREEGIELRKAFKRRRNKIRFAEWREMLASLCKDARVSGFRLRYSALFFFMQV